MGSEFVGAEVLAGVTAIERIEHCAKPVGGHPRDRERVDLPSVSEHGVLLSPVGPGGVVQQHQRSPAPARARRPRVVDELLDQVLAIDDVCDQLRSIFVQHVS
jgi:hypothetical protein